MQQFVEHEHERRRYVGIQLEHERRIDGGKHVG
jgi:hypothetical protein